MADRKELRQNKSIDRIKAEHEMMLSDLEALENLTPEAASQVYAELDYMVSNVHEAIRKATSLEEAGDTAKQESPTAKGLDDAVGGIAGAERQDQSDAAKGLDGAVDAIGSPDLPDAAMEKPSDTDMSREGGSNAIPLDAVLEPTDISSLQPASPQDETVGEKPLRDTSESLDDAVQSVSRQPFDVKPEEPSKEKVAPAIPSISLEEYAKQQESFKSEVNHEQLDAFISARHAQWQADRQKLPQAKIDLKKDHGMDPIPDVEGDMEAYFSAIATAIDDIHRMFIRMVDVLESHSHSLSVMQAELSRKKVVV